MAELHKGTWLRPSKLELVTAWLGHQRWYAGVGVLPDLTLVGAWRLGDPAGEVGIETLIVEDSAGPEPVVYQVPLTYRGAPVPGLEGALVGTMEHGVLGPRWVYDGPHDKVYAAQLLALVRGEVGAESSSQSDLPDDHFFGVPSSGVPGDGVPGAGVRPPTPGAMVSGCHVISGEQSNTSVIVDVTDGDGSPAPVIIKVFRRLAAGDNPDVVLQTALAGAGCDRVPSTIGAVAGHWSVPGSDEVVRGHLAFAQEFLPNVEDAWRIALRSAESGADFTGEARALGAATARVHARLATALGTRPVTAEGAAALVDEMTTRLDAALDERPELDRHRDGAGAAYDAARRATWPPLQRIHGDYHLGQVLHSPERGWILVDFEGEPLRPLTDRQRPDSVLRDIAGMLRSIDYAGGSVELERPGASTRDWVTAAQQAFLDGYADEGGWDPRDRPALLAAFELDKAMYEVVYETRHRPDWTGIPLAAIDRLATGFRTAPLETDSEGSAP